MSAAEVLMIDLAPYRRGDGLYQLPADLDIEGAELVDLELDRPIWSVGQCRSTGQRMAALDATFWMAPGFDNIWCRGD